jgi:hypothetical protein
MKTNSPASFQHGLRPLALPARGTPKLFQAGMATLLFPLLMLTNALALDRWSALAMVESNNNDHAVGRVGEVSRYQIRPELWSGGDPLDASTALANAQRIMAARMAAFQQSHGRVPDDFEFYILWNAPAQTDHPRHVVAERARLFMNLVGSDEPALPDKRVH